MFFSYLYYFRNYMETNKDNSETINDKSCNSKTYQQLNDDNNLAYFREYPIQIPSTKTYNITRYF